MDKAIAIGIGAFFLYLLATQKEQVIVTPIPAPTPAQPNVKAQSGAVNHLDADLEPVIGFPRGGGGGGGYAPIAVYTNQYGTHYGAAAYAQRFADWVGSIEVGQVPLARPGVIHVSEL